MYQIDVMSRKPVYEQLAEQMERFILRGVLHPGDKLPSVRSLSVELSVNPNTIQRTYTELDRRGVVHAVPGKGCFVSDDAKKNIGLRKRGEMEDFTWTVREYAMAGIEKSAIEECVDRAYREEEQE